MCTLLSSLLALFWQLVKCASDIYYQLLAIEDIGFPRRNAILHAPKEVTWETMSPIKEICYPLNEHKLTKAYRSDWLMSHLDPSFFIVASTSTA